MAQLHEALKLLQPRDFADVPTSDLTPFLTNLFAQCELIANTVPPPPDGTPYESAQRTRTTPTPATSFEDLTVSKVRRPPVASEHEELQNAWGKPLKLSKQDASLGISVFKMAGHDRHGAWFARTSVHEGLGFESWKRAMMREFPESLEVQGGPGDGNVRGIGGDRRLEDVQVEGVGKLEVYQLSAQFSGPTSPREFITLLLTSDNALTEASKVADRIPRHYMIVSIPVTHPDAPQREGMIRGKYESVELIREIPLPETQGSDAEQNPVEWIMITRSDPGGGIPRFMVERNTPASIVQDAVKFLRWACNRSHLRPPEEMDEEAVGGGARKSVDSQRAMSITDGKGVLAGVGTSIADNPRPVSFRRPSQKTVDKGEDGLMSQWTETIGSYIPQSLNPLHRTASRSSETSMTPSSDDSFASAEEDMRGDNLQSASEGAISISSSTAPDDLTSQAQTRHQRELEKIEHRRQQAVEKLRQMLERQTKQSEESTLKTQKALEAANEKHERERKKQEEKFEKEKAKLEAKREREAKKLLAKQQKEAEKNTVLKLTKERDEWKVRAEAGEKENQLLVEQLSELQKENTAFVAVLGRTEEGMEILRSAREEIAGGGSAKGRGRTDSRASVYSGKSVGSGVSGMSASKGAEKLAPSEG